jgi:anti-sigma B factor antagonist
MNAAVFSGSAILDIPWRSHYATRADNQPRWAVTRCGETLGIWPSAELAGSGRESVKKDSKVEFEASSHNIRSKRIDVKGEVDVNSAPVLLDQIHAAIAKKYEVIIINLGQVTRMDSAGVAVLVEGINEARKEKIILSLQDVSKPAQAVLEMARVDKLFQVSGKNYLPPQR